MPRPVTRSRAKEVSSNSVIPDEQRKDPPKRKGKTKSKTNHQRTSKKPRYEPIKFDRQINNPILNHLRDISKYDKHASCIDTRAILDHIALEGLTGIKFGYLLNILDSISPNSDYLNCTNSQLYIWTILLRCMERPAGTGIRIYHHDSKVKEAERERPEDSSCLMDKPINMPSLAWKRISDTELTLYPIQDGDTMGSCSDYLDRVDISEKILNLHKKLGSQASFYEVNNQFNFDNVYVVADQELRTRAIFPNHTDPNVFITIREYVCLEFIGKTRTYGAVFPNDKILGRYRIILSSKGFITQYQKSVQSHIVHHLKRFGQSSMKLFEGLACPSKPAFNMKGREGLGGDSELIDQYPVIQRTCCHPRRLKCDQDILKMVYEVIAEKPSRSSLDIRRKLKLPKSHVRNHIKNLLNVGLIGSHTKKVNDCLFRLYRTRHKTIKLKRKRKVDKEKLKGVMAKWDEIDVKAKSILGHKRSSFSRGEDSFLILCRIVTLLIEPNLRKLSFCHDKHFIRDLLHEEFVVSHNKTSDSCLRRIKYLRRLPQNLMYINELTAELREDSDINKLIGAPRGGNNEEERNKLFVCVLNAVRGRLPSLLGLPDIATPSKLSSKVPDATTSTTIGSSSAPKTSANNNNRLLRSLHRMSSAYDQHANRSASGLLASSSSSRIVINDYDELRSKYELVSCQSGPACLSTYDQFTDQAHRNICLVTVAFSLINSLDRTSPPRLTASIEPPPPPPKTTSLEATKRKNHHDVIGGRVTNTGDGGVGGSGDHSSTATNSATEMSPMKFRLLEKFYSNYSDKMVRTVLAKLNRGSLVARPTKSGKSLKLNQGVLISLNRYQSSSLMQLAHPIKAPKCQADATDATIATNDDNHHQVDGDRDDRQRENLDEFNESNEVTSIAKLTSLFTSCSFNLELKLPANVIDYDDALSDPMIVQPCNTRFTLNAQPASTTTTSATATSASDHIKESMDKFFGASQAAHNNKTSSRRSWASSKWLVKGYKPDGDASDFDPKREPQFSAIEFEARPWKSIDGSVHIRTLLKLIESLLSSIVVFPGIEHRALYREFCHLMAGEHLLELLQLMERLSLIKSEKVDDDVEFNESREARLFGYVNKVKKSPEENLDDTTYEPQANAFNQFSCLLNKFN